MAEHDLWNEEDFFEKLKKEKRAAEKPQSPEQPEPEQELPPSPLEEEPEPLESDLFEKEEPAEQQAEEPSEEDIFFGAEEESQPSQPPETAQEFEEEENAQLPSFEDEDDGAQEIPYGQEDFSEPAPVESEEEEVSEQPPKKYALSDNYEDEKLAPVNYKPVIIGAVVVVLLIVLFFVLRGLFFSGKGEKEAQQATKPQTEQKAAAQKAQAQNPLQVKQKQFFAQLAGANAFNLGLIQNIQGAISTKNAQITSILLYNDEITFEIHCKNRDVLAKVTMNLRAAPALNDLKLISTNEWPGGAIDGVFHAKIVTPAQSATAGAKIADVGSLEQWLKMVGQQFSVQVGSFTELGTASASLGLSRERVMFQGQGTYQGVLNFINAIASANRNLKVHKLVLTALSRKNFNKSKYRVELTLDLFK